MLNHDEHHEPCRTLIVGSQERLAPDDPLIRFNGGWGRCDGELPTMSATADAMRIYEMCGGDLKDALVGDAVRFVSQELKLVLDADQKMFKALRHECSVHEVSSGLRVLSLSKVKASGKTARDVRERAAQWLLDNRAAGGAAWGTHGKNRPELLPTYHAVWALDVETSTVPGTGEAAKAGRKWIQDRGVKLEDGTLAWRQTATSKHLSPSATAWAVLSLSHGDPEQQAAALRGVRWLLRDAERWLEHEPYEEAEMRGYKVFPAYVLCALACVRGLKPSRQRTISDPREQADLDATYGAVQRTFSRLNEVWSKYGSWADHQHAAPFLGTVRLIHSLNRKANSMHGWATVDAPAPAAQEQSGADAPLPTWSFGKGRAICVWCDGKDDPIEIPLSEGNHELLQALHAAAPDGSWTCRGKLGARLKDGKKEGAVRGRATRLNAEIAPHISGLNGSDAKLVTCGNKTQDRGGFDYPIRLNWDFVPAP